MNSIRSVRLFMANLLGCGLLDLILFFVGFIAVTLSVGQY